MLRPVSRSGHGVAQGLIGGCISTVASGKKNRKRFFLKKEAKTSIR
jgi:hypothetical protein